MTLNSEQEAAVAAREGYWKVEAGPGSGKTKCLIERYRRLVDSGEDAAGILCLTFTNEAAKEMRGRAGITAETKRPSGFRTLHSLALSFVTEEHENWPYKLNEYFPLATPDVAAKFVGSALHHASGVRFRELMTRISDLKRAGVSPEQAEESAVEARDFGIAAAYRHYQTALRKEGLLDFDDLIEGMRDLLQGSLGVFDRWQYKWLMVDEAPDCDKVQWETVRQLSQDHRNVWAVGDPNQVIYEWRDARPDLFADLEQFFPGMKTLYLPTNYRSSPQIVRLIQRIAPVRDGLSEQFRSANPDGPEPEFRVYDNNISEAETVARAAAESTDPKQDAVAIIARTNKQLGFVEEILGERGVKYHLLGRSGFWNQAEVRNVLAYVQIATIPTDPAILAAIRAPFEPSRYIRKKEFIARLQAEGEHHESLWRALEHLARTDASAARLWAAFTELRRGVHFLDAKSAMKTVLTRLNAVEHYGDDSVPDSSPADNILMMQDIASRFDTLSDFLGHVRKAQAAQRGRRNRVVLATAHAAKGHEWQTVFIIGANDSTMPHQRSENIEEEQRILFVAASRAARRLVISWYGTPSRFLKDIIQKTDEEGADDGPAENNGL